MRIGGIAVEELAARFRTPAYVYDGTVFEARAAALRATLPERVDVAYAVKANPNPRVVAAVTGDGLGADVASLGELRLALAAGVPAGRILVTGPGKGEPLLEAAVAAGVRAITVESLGELARIETVAERVGRRVPVLVRAAAVGDGGVERRPLIDALRGKFGMDRSDLAAAVERAARSPHLDWLGVHAFSASNVLDAAVLVEHAAATLRLADELGAVAGGSARVVDIGGGLGIPYGDDEPALDIEALCRGLGVLLDRYPHTRLLIEPGRWLVGPAGWYLTRVVDTKRVDGRAIAVVDGGIHHLLRPALVGRPHRIAAVVAPARGAAAREPVAVVGPLCTGLDVLDPAACLPPLEPGDLLVVQDVGAYGFTESMPFFLSHPTPPEILVRDGRAELIRPSFEPDRWLDATPEPAAILGA